MQCSPLILLHRNKTAKSTRQTKKQASLIDPLQGLASKGEDSSKGQRKQLLSTIEEDSGDKQRGGNERRPRTLPACYSVCSAGWVIVQTANTASSEWRGRRGSKGALILPSFRSSVSSADPPTQPHQASPISSPPRPLPLRPPPRKATLPFKNTTPAVHPKKKGQAGRHTIKQACRSYLLWFLRIGSTYFSFVAEFPHTRKTV
mmetsp:Transcript_45740/g.90090  ORF Transcript_45740/g.90090 Transcript_45740/m.90090 type:complete len:203 (-) Transcript_45740:575-1183(-)